jgi:hypothetical protein
LFVPRLDVPAGYERRDIRQSAILIANPRVVDPLARALETGLELIEFAAKVAGARHLQGRQAAYGITLEDGTRVVVRRNHHGGAFRKLTRSIFVFPTRAPRELEISLALQQLAIRTPPVLAIVIYPGEFIEAWSDVVTEEIAPSRDFGAFLLETRPDSVDRVSGWAAVHALLQELAVAGVRHHDLNVKNVLLQRTAEGAFVAYMLDVDRVKLAVEPAAADEGNRARLLRSLEKWRDTRGVNVSAAELERLRRTAPNTP